MTDKQKAYIKYLDDKLTRLGKRRRSTDEDLLGKGWEENYKNFTPTYTEEVINHLHTSLGMSPRPKPQPKKRRR